MYWLRNLINVIVRYPVTRLKRSFGSLLFSVTKKNETSCLVWKLEFKQEAQFLFLEFKSKPVQNFTEAYVL